MGGGRERMGSEDDRLIDQNANAISWRGKQKGVADSWRHCSGRASSDRAQRGALSLLRRQRVAERCWSVGAWMISACIARKNSSGMQLAVC